MRKFKVIVGVISLLLLLQFTLVLPVSGITQATPDTENIYSSVGVLKIDQDGTLNYRCSGTLISPTAFLMDGHCPMSLLSHPTWKGYISFDKNYLDDVNDNWIEVTDFLFDALNGNSGNGVGGYHRLSIVYLPIDFTTGHAPAKLTTAGLLDDLSAQNGLNGVEFTTVGYGPQVLWGDGKPFPFRDGWRNYSSAPFQALTLEWLHLNINEDATGGGGGCGQDRGGPVFLPDGEENILVGVASPNWSYQNCRALGEAYRLDTPWAQWFLRTYVKDLP